MLGEYIPYTDIGGRKENEDTVSVHIYKNNLVAVVADGLGGQGDGKAASQSVCLDLETCGADGRMPTKDALSRAFEDANASLMRKQRNSYHMKTTAVYLCIHGNTAIWAHVGDSRLYHVYGGRLAHYTLDHSASQMAVFMGDIRREDIPKDAGRSRLIRAMGVEDVKADVFGPIDLEQEGRHAFLLCSDGLWEYLSDEEIVQACTESEDVETCLDRLLALKRSRSAEDCDNNSAILIFGKGS